jgi:hypothetical protein
MQRTELVTLKKPPVGCALPNTPLYDMIRFWGRKPYNLVSNYIKHYTEPDEIVLDPFSGCGVVSVESLKLKRKAIYNDINKLFKLIAKVSTKPVDIQKLTKTIDDIIKNVKKSKIPIMINNKKTTKLFEWLYTTTCDCGYKQAKIVGTHFTRTYKIKKTKRLKSNTLDGRTVSLPDKLAKDESKLGQIAIHAYKIIKNNKEITTDKLYEEIRKLNLTERTEEITRAINEKLDQAGFIEVAGEIPFSINYECPNPACKIKRGHKKPDKEDLKRIKIINDSKPPYKVPHQKLEYPNGSRFETQRPGTERVDLLFTNRNLIALSVLRHEIKSLKIDNDIKDSLLLGFASILYECSRMKREGAGSWGEKNYVIRPVFYELNILHVFENRMETISLERTE